MREIKFYQTAKGKEPVKEFLNSLQSKQAQKVAWVMSLIEDLRVVPKQYFKKLINTDDIWEIRAQAGNNIFRVFSFFDGSKVVVACHGITKKKQRIPKKDIQITEKRKTDYFRRKENE